MTTARFVVEAARRSAPPTPVPVPAEAPSGPPSPPFPAARIAVWQAALVAGFAGLGRGTAVTVVTASVAVGVLVLSAVRIRGQWLSTLASDALSFVLRRRTRDAEWLPLPPGSVLLPSGAVTGAAGVTLVARTSRTALPHLEADAGGPELTVRLVLHAGPAQAQPEGWLAVTARRSAEADSDEILGVALDNALRRLRKAERPAEVTVLGGPDLDSAVRRIARTGPAREGWTGWRSGSVTQICLRTRVAHPDALLRLLGAVPGAAVTVALHRHDDAYAVVLRLAAGTPEAAERATARLTEHAARLGVRLDRLDGRHGPAVLASLPTGGTL